MDVALERATYSCPSANILDDIFMFIFWNVFPCDLWIVEAHA